MACRLFFTSLCILLFLGLLCYSDVSAQMLNNSEGDAFLESPFFDAEHIRANKIKKISGSYHFKKLNDRMRATNLIYGCEFDTLGHITKQYETKNIGNKIDTVVCYYEYNHLGLLLTKRKYELSAYFAEVYDYDSLRRLIKIEYRRDLNRSSNPLTFVLEKQYLVSYETISYERFDRQEKRTHYNNFGMPFQYSFFYYNDLGYLTQIVDNMAVSSGQRKVKFEYNERGFIAEKSVISTVMGNSAFQIHYLYDRFGNFEQSDLYRNNVHISQTQIIYNSKTGLVSSLLKRQIDNNLITILQFDSYEFY